MRDNTLLDEMLVEGSHNNLIVKDFLHELLSLAEDLDEAINHQEIMGRFTFVILENSLKVEFLSSAELSELTSSVVD